MLTIIERCKIKKGILLMIFSYKCSKSRKIDFLSFSSKHSRQTAKTHASISTLGATVCLYLCHLAVILDDFELGGLLTRFPFIFNKYTTFVKGIFKSVMHGCIFQKDVEFNEFLRQMSPKYTIYSLQFLLSNIYLKSDQKRK